MEKELISNGKKRILKPETLMMGYGYKPEWSEEAVKCPFFQTSNFVFENVRDGKEFWITDNLLRLSVDVEAAEDIIWDLDQALA